MRDHAVPVSGRALHRAPAVVLRCRLLVPDVAGVARNVARLERGGNVLGDAERSAGGVDDPAAGLEVGEGLLAVRGKFGQVGKANGKGVRTNLMMPLVVS